MAKKVDLKAKAKRQKIVAGVLGVLFLAVLGFEGPKMLKQLTGPSVDPLRAAQTSTTTPTGPVPLAPPTLGGTPTPATPTGSGQLAAASGTATTPLDQLTSFSLFASKDPFIQQVTPNGGSPTTPPGGAGPGGTTPKPGGPAPSPPSSPTPPQPKPPAPAPTAAVISVNGAPAQLIQIAQDFPLPPYDPIFHLVSLRPGVAKIAIAGGSYTSGAPTVTLKKGKPLTLENTADGTRYVLKLLWTGTGQPPPNLIPLPSSTVPAPSTPAPTTTTTTTTTTTR